VVGYSSPWKDEGQAAFFVGAMKRKEVNVPPIVCPEVDLSALYPADGWEWLKTDQTVPRRPRAKSDRAGPTAARLKRLKP
jgi:hypothetical protein